MNIRKNINTTTRKYANKIYEGLGDVLTKPYYGLGSTGEFIEDTLTLTSNVICPAFFGIGAGVLLGAGALYTCKDNPNLATLAGIEGLGFSALGFDSARLNLKDIIRWRRDEIAWENRGVSNNN